MNVELVLYLICRTNIPCLDYSRELKATEEVTAALTKYTDHSVRAGNRAL